MFQIEESQARFWDAFCKIVATAAIVVGGGWTLYTYLQTRATEMRTAAIEARKPFLDKRLELYFEAASAAATIPTADAQKAAIATEEFWKLYWGPLVLVEDAKVEAAVKDIADCLRQRSKAPLSCDAKKLRQLSLTLAHNCRESIGSGWDVELSRSDTEALFDQ